MTCNPYWTGRSAGRRRRVVNPDRAAQLARDARAPAHKLKLKKGMVVMLLRNLNPIEGLCNGTRLLVEDVIEGRKRASSLTVGADASSPCARRLR